MTHIPIALAERFVLVGGADGKTLVSPDSPLRRLNYFDGKFLRAEHLRQEQMYLRSLAAQSNRAGGAGVVHGYDVELRGDQLRLGPGLAIDPEGRVLLLGGDESVALSELIEGARRVRIVAAQRRLRPDFDDCELVRLEPNVEPTTSSELYLISIAHAETLCGEEDVYGRLCEEACITDTARPFLVEGVVVRARVLSLPIDYGRSGVVPLRPRPHLRSLAASAYFAFEGRGVPTHITGDGLREGSWCAGSQLGVGIDVPIAVLGRRGSANLFLDPWIVRRERIETPPRRYWAWRMNMRPWDVFLAQVLQFQCQLMSLLRPTRQIVDPDGDLCQGEREVMREAADSIKSLKQLMAGMREEDRAMLTRVNLPEGQIALGDHLHRVLGIDDRLREVLRNRRVVRSTRILVDGGIVELPPAGYLPIDPAAAEPIESQVRRYMGAGVALRFCVAPADQLAHLFEQAQHMARIDLLVGLDNPRRRSRVEIVVPDGRFEEIRHPPELHGFQLEIGPTLLVAGENEFIPRPFQFQLIAGEAVNVGAVGGAPPLAMGAAPPPAAGAAAAPVNVGAALGGMVSADLGRDLFATLVLAHLQSRLIGAGRGEVLPTGGGLFYLAGTAPSDAGQDVVLRAVDATVRRMAAAAREPAPREEPEADGVSFFEHVVRDARDILRDVSPDAFAARRVVRKAAARPRGARRAAEAEPLLNARAPMSYTRIPPHLINPRAQQPGSAFWGKARITHDPFGLLPGRATDVELRLMLARGANAAKPLFGVIEVSLTGKLTVTGAPVTVGAITTLPVTMEARIHVEITQPTGASLCFSMPVSRSLTLERFDDGGHEAVRIRIPLRAQRQSIMILAHWPGTSLGVDAEVLFGVEIDSVTYYVLALALDHNNDVFDPANIYHRAAITALEFLATSKNDPAFASREANNLFRPSPVLEMQRRVRTQRDWVLFRRWRQMNCGGPAAPPAPPKYRTYMTYLITIDGVSFEKYGDAIFGGSPQLNPRRVGPIEFEGEGSRITSDIDGYRIAYQAQGPGKLLLVAGIGARGEAAGDSDALAKARLTRLGNELSAITNLPPTGDPFRIVRTLPDVLDPESTDGVILIVTTPPAVTTEHEFILFLDFQQATLTRLETEGFADRSDPRLDTAFPRIRFVDGVLDVASFAPIKDRLTKPMYRNLRIYTKPGVDQAARENEAAQVLAAIGSGAPTRHTLANLHTTADALLLLL